MTDSQATDKSRQELLPCPFCGEAPTRADRADDHTPTKHIWFIACHCGSYSSRAHQYGLTEAEVIAKWNRRAAATYQERVRAFMVECFGSDFFTQGLERDHRFLEEALELVQANGCTAPDAHMLVDYVYGRQAGKPHQECGGVMTTLAAVCLSRGLDMAQAGEDELARVWTKIDVIREKQRTKPKGPLPQIASSSSDTAQVDVLPLSEVLMRERAVGYREGCEAARVDAEQMQADLGETMQILGEALAPGGGVHIGSVPQMARDVVALLSARTEVAAPIERRMKAGWCREHKCPMDYCNHDRRKK